VSGGCSLSLDGLVVSSANDSIVNRNSHVSVSVRWCALSTSLLAGFFPVSDFDRVDTASKRELRTGKTMDDKRSGIRSFKAR
jgi:hypothetical protein